MRLWLIAGALALAWPLPGLSSDPGIPAPVELPPVVVPLPEEEPEPARRDPTGSVTVIEVQSRAAEAKDTAELIASAPGVHLQQVGGVGQKETLILRGASSSGVLVFLDGIPLNGAGGIADLSLLPAALIDRLEILRGGAGTAYGTGGLGGAVNAITRRVPRGVRLFADLRYGSFDTAVATLGAAMPLFGGEALVMLHGTRSDGDYLYRFDPEPSNPDNALVNRIRLNNGAAIGGAMFKLTHRLWGWTTHVLVDGLAYDRGLAGTSRNPSFDARDSGNRWMVAARATGEWMGAVVGVRAYDRLENTRLSGGIFATLLEQRFNSAGGGVDASWAIGGSQLLTLALEGGVDSLRAGQQAPALGRAGLVVADELLLLDGRLTVAPSLRLEVVHALATANGAAEVTHALWSPKLGAAWTFGGGFEVRGNVGQSHRAPSMLELYVAEGSLLPNPALRPERALHADLTAAWSGTHRRASVTGFYAVYDDLIAYEYYPPFAARPFNFDSARVGGAEVEAAAELPYSVRAEGSYTLTLSQNLRDDPRYHLRELPNRPRHKAQLRVSAGPDWLRTRAEVDHRSGQYLNRSETLSLPARTLLNVGITSRLLKNPDLQLSLELRNALDVHTQDFDDYPLPGRSLHFTLSAALEPRSPSSEVPNPTTP